MARSPTKLAQRIPRKGISSLFLARATMVSKSPLANSPDHAVPCQAGIPAPAQTSQSAWGHGLGSSGPQRRCPESGQGGKPADTHVRQWTCCETRQRTKYSRNNALELQMEGKTVWILCQWRGKWSKVDRQCHSRNRSKYIYINSLLYNHDKTKNKKNHSHKNINLK